MDLPMNDADLNEIIDRSHRLADLRGDIATYGQTCEHLIDVDRVQISFVHVTNGNPIHLEVWDLLKVALLVRAEWRVWSWEVVRVTDVSRERQRLAEFLVALRKRMVLDDLSGVV